MKKIVRSICLFRKTSVAEDTRYLKNLVGRIESAGYMVQTSRLCFQDQDILKHDKIVNDPNIYLSVGGLDFDTACECYPAFLLAKNSAFHLDLIRDVVEQKHVDYFLKILRDAPHKSFSFAFMFRNAPSSPFFPSAHFEREGFSIGLQATDLATNCSSLEQWFVKQRQVWEELCSLFSKEPDFLGIDSSVAPLFNGTSSLVGVLSKMYGAWNQIVLSDVFLRITEFIKKKNLKPIGLCGLMLPCLEDFELAEQYEQGKFSIERNIFLSLHCGLGIDTYPLAMDEQPETILAVLRLLQGLSQKYSKCLSARFISDGQAKIGQRTNFNNPYLKNITVRSLV